MRKTFDDINDTLFKYKVDLEKRVGGFIYSTFMYQQKSIIKKFLENYSEELKSDELNIINIRDIKESGEDNLYLEIIYGYGKFSIDNCEGIREGEGFPVKYLYHTSNLFFKDINSEYTIKDFNDILLSVRKNN